MVSKVSKTGFSEGELPNISKASKNLHTAWHVPPASSQPQRGHPQREAGTCWKG